MSNPPNPCYKCFLREAGCAIHCGNWNKYVTERETKYKEKAQRKSDMRTKEQYHRDAVKRSRGRIKK